jgi:hypothetical protein
MGIYKQSTKKKKMKNNRKPLELLEWKWKIEHTNWEIRKMKCLLSCQECLFLYYKLFFILKNIKLIFLSDFWMVLIC